MYGKFLYALGIAFILFVVIMFIGNLFRSGFSGILKFFFSRLLIIIFITSVCLVIGIFIYSAVEGENPWETINFLWNLVKMKLSSI
jgi:hypothetical protein